MCMSAITPLSTLWLQTKLKKLTYVSTKLNSMLSWFLAPTGALVVMMVYYTYIHTYIYQPIFSAFYSVPWCNWCYKCHSNLESKSLKQYQCNWYHKMEIDADWMLNVPMFQCSNVPMFQWSNVQIFKCSIVPMIQCSNVFFFSKGFKSFLSIGPLVH